MKWALLGASAALVFSTLAGGCSATSTTVSTPDAGSVDATGSSSSGSGTSSGGPNEAGGLDALSGSGGDALSSGSDGSPSGDAGTDSAAACGYVESACKQGSDCCSGNCEGGACGFSSRGQPCSIDNDCFGGTCVGGACACVIDSVTGVIPYVPTNSPTVCRADGDCCTGHCGRNDTEGVFRGNGRVCCREPGAACTDLTQCCSDDCIGGVCQCTTTGNCMTASDCCTGQCNAGTCLACFKSGACQMDIQCCTGKCSGGQCTTPVVCTPSCAGKVCGPNGCGSPCGTCPVGQQCNGISGQCAKICSPSCEGRVCGADGCGGTCGSCTSGQGCDTSGACVGTGSTSGSGGGGATCPDDTPCNSVFTSTGVCAEYKGVTNNCGHQSTCRYTMSDGSSGCVFPLPGTEDCEIYDPNYAGGTIVCVPAGNIACEDVIGCE